MGLARVGRFVALCLATVLATATASGGQLVSGGRQRAPAGRPEGPVRPAEFGGPERYLTHVSTDKPVYRPGEYVRVRGVILRAGDARPLTSPAQAEARFEIVARGGRKVGSGSVRAKDSVLGFSWRVSENLPAGRYTVKIGYRENRFAPAERTFRVYPYRRPRLRARVDYLRDGYGPGDRVAATVHVERAEGGFPVGAEVTAVARVDGAKAARASARVDEKGDCVVFLDLPRRITRGEGTLAVTVEDGGVVETVARTIPILLQQIDVATYPEGGDLVAGLPARVYFEARTPTGGAADVAGVVVNARGARVAAFRTEHEGRGRVSFVPRRGERYSLRVLEPSGIAATHPLPEVKPAGAVVGAVEDITPAGRPVRLLVGATSARTLRVTLSKREVQVASKAVSVRPCRLSCVELKPSDRGGVFIATVWDKRGKTPLAERLVYREPARRLRIEVACDGGSHIPGGEAKVRVRTTDGKGRPVGAVVGLAVTDQSALEVVDPRERAPRLPAMVFLENEVRELADAHVYLDRRAPGAPLAMDLLLGTQGWRRFAFLEPAEFIADHGDGARRALALKDFKKGSSPKSNRDRTVALGVSGLGAAVSSQGSPGSAALGAASVGPGPAGGAAGQGKLLSSSELAEVGPTPDGTGLVMSGESDGEPDQIVRFSLVDPEAPDRRPDGHPLLPGPSRGNGGASGAARPESNDHDGLVLARVYAHRARPGRIPGQRRDFTETVYWNAALTTDPRTGEATVSFALSDAVTIFRALADGFTSGGAVGKGDGELRSVKPFYCGWKLPARVSPGDSVRVPVTVVNQTCGDLAAVRIMVRATGGTIGSLPGLFDLAAQERVRRLVDLRVGERARKIRLTVSADAGPYHEGLTRTIAVKSPYFPVEVSSGGVIGPGRLVRKRVDISEDAVPSSASVYAALYPTPMANLTESIRRLSREPTGCFSQMSSQIYLTVMAQRYFETHRGVDAELVRHGRAFVARGIKRLIGYASGGGGYEWFGGGPGNEALTAYGLMLFTDLEKLGFSSARAAKRARGWLVSRRDGRGGFSKARGEGGSYGRAPRSTTDAYVTWALLESGEKRLERETGAMRRAALRTRDSYVLALAANVLLHAGDRPAAKRAMRRLAERQKEEGWVDGAVTSITGSAGGSLKVETTALAILAWLRDADFAAEVHRGMKFLSGCCRKGYYGSTQATVMALRAVIAHDIRRARPREDGTVRLCVDDEPCGGERRFCANTDEAVRLPRYDGRLGPGEHTIALVMDGGSPMRYSLALDYFSRKPPSASGRALGLDVSLAERELVEGEATEAKVVVTNLTEKPVSMPVVVVGLPAGLEPRHDRLEELVKAGGIDSYEVTGGDVVLYWRGMVARARRELRLGLVAAVPGVYAVPPSRAYLYYADELKAWAEGGRVAISPRAAGTTD